MSNSAQCSLIMAGFTTVIYSLWCEPLCQLYSLIPIYAPSLACQISSRPLFYDLSLPLISTAHSLQICLLNGAINASLSTLSLA